MLLGNALYQTYLHRTTNKKVKSPLRLFFVRLRFFFSKTVWVEEVSTLKTPIVEFYYKNDDLMTHSSMMSMWSFDIANDEQIAYINEEVVSMNCWKIGLHKLVFAWLISNWIWFW